MTTRAMSASTVLSLSMTSYQTSSWVFIGLGRPSGLAGEVALDRWWPVVDQPDDIEDVDGLHLPHGVQPC